MKKFFIKLFIDRFKQKGYTKYLAINTEYGATTNFTIDGIFECTEGKNLKEIKDFLNNDVPKSKRKNWKIYVEHKEKSNDK